tara:strand:+ start:708 stop:1982 length:1275 start_codon:yes stop_codon:yes gene_type:complete
MFEDYSPEVQDFIKNIGLYVFNKLFNNLSETEILQKCSNNSVEDIVQNYEEQLNYLKITNLETIQEIKNNNQYTLDHKQQTIDDLQNKMNHMKFSESENIQNALDQNNKLHELEKQNLLNKISFLEKEQSVKNLIEERFCDKTEFSNPTEQGDYAEKILDAIINEGLPFDDKVKVEDTSDYGGSGDRIITFGNGCRLMVEVKNKDPVKKTDIDEFERHYTKDFKEGKVDLACFLSYRTPQIPQKCKAIIPSYHENNKVIYFGMDDSLDKEQKKLKIKNCLEEIFQLFERNKNHSKTEKEDDENKVNVYNIILKELRDNLSHTDKSIKESSANMETLKQRRINIVKQLNTIFRMIHSENINVDKSLLDDKLYRNEIIERIKDWFKTADDVKKKDWKKNMKRDLKETWSDYDLGILTRIKRSEFTI